VTPKHRVGAGHHADGIGRELVAEVRGVELHDFRRSFLPFSVEKPSGAVGCEAAPTTASQRGKDRATPGARRKSGLGLHAKQGQFDLGFGVQ
jgi:hypothetical protein